ncbi:unnamed protein product [Triticum turgidum subsp. durum]|uniref:Nuclear pore complex NUP2/50/61 domain-containing protein n=1 Tax=Triticum turgidum subsp. durum TaxID=4567 RepID=A0A9R1A9Q6_TRITD|nr:unnamed protein product [Triticum turgidum subsp. durum]
MVVEEHPQTSRKRAADKQINKDNPELDDGSPEQEARTFKKARKEVLTIRTTVEVTSQQPLPAPSSNPFSAIRFTPSDSGVKGSIPISKSPPSDVATTNVKGSGAGDKVNGCSNGSRKDADKNADCNEAAEVQKDESGMKDLDAEKKSNVPTGSNSLLIGTDSKADSTGLGTGEDGVLVVEPNEDSSKSWGIKSKTEDAVAEEKKVNEDGHLISSNPLTCLIWLVYVICCCSILLTLNLLDCRHARFPSFLNI